MLVQHLGPGLAVQTPCAPSATAFFDKEDKAYRSNKHVWHTPLILAHVVQTSVFLYRAP